MSNLKASLGYFVKKIPLPAVILLLISPTFVSLVRAGFYSMQDDMQAFRLQQLDRCIQDLQIPCRWVPDMGYQYGYPQFNYYPPAVYYLGELFHLMGGQFIDTVKILFILGFIVSALAMYLFLKSFLGVWPAVVGSVLYSFVPYKAVEVYVRGSLSEFWALAIFPLIFWSSHRLIISQKSKYIYWLSLSTALLLITHNLMSLIFLPVALAWIVLHLYLEKKWLILPQLIFSLMLAIGLSGFFVLPMLLEKGYAHLETLLGGYFDYRQHFVSLYQLFISNHWGYGSSILGPSDDLSLSTGIVQWIGGLIAVTFATVRLRKDKKLALTIYSLAAMELFVLFLMHQKSSFLWERLTLLWWLQFPWRFMSLSVFLLSLLSALAVYLISKWSGRVGIYLGMAMIVSTYGLYLNFFHPKDWFPLSDKEKFSGYLWEKQLTISIFDYLPIFAQFPPTSKAPKEPEILAGQAKFLTYHKGSNYQIGEVEALTPSLIRLPLFDFPGMQVSIDNKVVNHQHNDCQSEAFCLGLIGLNLPSGRHTLKATLSDTPIRKIGNTLSLISILALITFALKSFLADKKG